MERHQKIKKQISGSVQPHAYTACSCPALCFVGLPLQCSVPWLWYVHNRTHPYLYQNFRIALLALMWFWFVASMMFKIGCIKGTWVAQSVKLLASAQVTISLSVSSSPASGSVLTAQSLEPASDSVSPSLSLTLPHSRSVSLSQKMNKCFKN